MKYSKTKVIDDNGTFITLDLWSGVPFALQNLNETYKHIKQNENNNKTVGNNSVLTIWHVSYDDRAFNYWALLAIILVLFTAAGNILVCLAITWERRLQNVTNYFLMSLAITDLMVAVLVMPLGIVILVKGYFPLQSEHCLTWICLDVLFCTASIMHLCTISIDRYLSLRYPMKFGRNKTRKRVTIKIIFVWLLSIAMSLPLSLMYSKNHASVLVRGTCQIPDPVYKLVGSIICFYIPLGVMLVTYCLTVRLLARKRQNMGGNSNHTNSWASGWLGQQIPALERQYTWRRFLKSSLPSTPSHAHSATSTDTELSTFDNHELWLPDSSIPESTPSTLTVLQQFGAEMLKLSRGLESVSSPKLQAPKNINLESSGDATTLFTNTISKDSNKAVTDYSKKNKKRRSTLHVCLIKYENADDNIVPMSQRKRFYSLPRLWTNNDHTNFQNERQIFIRNITDGAESTSASLFVKTKKFDFPPCCTCPYFGNTTNSHILKPTELTIMPPPQSSRPIISNLLQDKRNQNYIRIPSSISIANTSNTTNTINKNTSPQILKSTSCLQLLPVSSSRKLSYSKSNSIVTWDSRRNQRRGSSVSGVRTSLLLTPTRVPTAGPTLRRSATVRLNNQNLILNRTIKAPSTPCLLERSNTIKSHHSRNSSVISRNSSRHGRIILLEQKATKVLGVVFFTFVVLWAPFFVLNLLPTICETCEHNLSNWVFDVVTWLGYSSSMVNPIFYTIFNKVFRQAFRKVICCKYNKSRWRPQR